MFQPLNPLTVPIAHTNLIEASAGTGKTWNIAALFTRLIVLEHYRVDKILVVTFTKAATAELKTRLRARLDEALAILKKTPHAAENLDLLEQNCWINGKFEPFRFKLLQQALNQESQARLELRLKAAISEFDNAAIYTIHGFCQRVLQDFAFLCQVPFDIQLDEQSADNQYLTAAQDFWRTQVAPNPQLAALVYRYKLTPQNQLAALKSFLSRPYLPFRQPESTAPYTELWANFQAAWQGISQKIQAIETAFWTIHPDLNGNSYRTDTFRNKFTELLGQPENPNPLILQKILYNSDMSYQPFSAECLQTKVKKGKTPNPKAVAQISELNELTQIVDELIAAEQALLHELARNFTAYLRTQRRELKKHSPQRVFDDLLLDVHAALMENHEYSQTLAHSLAQNWQVALIDEFQDTDPLQYAIFRTAFADTNTPLFLVGDPKQAIYSFRGADIFAYLQAVKDSQQHYTLDTNRRSHRLLINSIGKFFERNQPFALPEIDYVKVNASRDAPDLSPAGRAVQVRWLPNADGLNTDGLVRESAAICAAQIADLLAQSFSGSLKFKDQPLHAGQIAVLVRARKDGAIMQRELKKRNIQSVLLSRESVFAEAEALAVAALLEFMIQPQKTGLLRFVLSGCLFEYDSAALHDLNLNENKLLAWIDSANKAHEIWLQDGIYAALQAFFAQHGVETRLLTQNQERTLTNLHQIMELLAQEDELSHTPTSLLQWLNREIQAASKQKNSHDHHILRLESDEQLVKIVTMHAAKGLQYPIVFCPFLWKASEVSTRTDWHISHERGFAEIISKTQYKQSDDDRENIKLAHLSEDLRLLYVALTRAEERLYLYVSHFQTSEKSDKSNKNQEDNLDLKYKNALAYLLNADEKLSKNATAYEAHWREFLANQTLDETDIEFVVHDDLAFSGSLQTENPPPKPIFHATEFAPRRFQFVQHASFTSLSRQTERAAAELSPMVDADELTMVAPTAPPPDGDSIHAFPQGAAAGVCLHSVLEKLHFRQPASEQIDLIDEKLIYHGFDPEIWREAVVQMCDFARETPLLPRVNLAALNQRNTLSEMNFLLHTDDFRLADIQAWLAAQDLPDEIIQATRHLAFRDVRGYLNGAIDLVAQFQGKTLILDYKSNYLGNSAAAYTPNAMDAAMAEHHYYLQALIYAIAVARYLQSRGVLPEMLSVRYLFLRGLDGISDNGVWAWDIRTADLARWL
ncbi:exodeoxyribonuclease V subunit beta [Alysiella crassa]|uniref:RecBCD enzyme subunit RecB n=1 Tax=Alysiella crassa TaxID=153491 RepID=A0A376BVD9_9NEIS|nr:exodeoxyribonuclease V subunit beta [Alysiella crassa]UOP06297.1 exodeoxyribonuclease V subunit beta [Alysiella crassa]SSY80801.1 Exodeoxyribonuclease V beta chain [Alysiella crassa]